MSVGGWPHLQPAKPDATIASLTNGSVRLGKTRLGERPHARAFRPLSERGPRYKVENSQGIVGGEFIIAVDLGECRAGRARGGHSPAR